MGESGFFNGKSSGINGAARRVEGGREGGEKPGTPHAHPFLNERRERREGDFLPAGSCAAGCAWPACLSPLAGWAWLHGWLELAASRVARRAARFALPRNLRENDGARRLATLRLAGGSFGRGDGLVRWMPSRWRPASHGVALPFRLPSANERAELAERATEAGRKERFFGGPSPQPARGFGHESTVLSRV